MREWTARVSELMRGRGGTAAIAQTLITRFFIIGINVLTGTITARVLGPDGRGEQAAIGVWPMFFAYAMSLGLPSALLYSVKRYPETRSQSFSAALLLGTGMSALGAVIGVFTVPFVLKNYSAEIVNFAQWMMFAVPLVLFTEILRAAMEASDQFAIANQIRYFPPISTLVMLVALALTQRLTAATAILSYWLPLVPILTWMLLRSRRFFQIRLTQIRGATRQLLTYGLRAYGIDLITSVTTQFQQVLAVSLLSPSAMGLYAITYSLCQLLSIVQASFVTVLFPKAAARPKEEVVEMTGRAVRVSGLLAFVFALSLMIAAPFILNLLYGKAYLDAIPIFRILAIEMVLSGTSIVLSQAFMALDRPGVVTVMQSLSLSIAIPLIFWLTPRFGLEGLGFALLIATSIRLILVLACYPIVLKMRPPSLLFVRQDFEILKQKIFQRF